MPLPSLAAIAIREGTFQQGVENTPPPPAMLDQKEPGRIRVKSQNTLTVGSVDNCISKTHQNVKNPLVAVRMQCKCDITRACLDCLWSGVRMANNSHPIFYFRFHSFMSLGAATLYIIVSTNQFKKHL